VKTASRFVLAFALFISFVRVAHADDRAHARAAFRAGSQHYNLGEFQAALESFREAYRAYEEPSFLYNIAQCERQLGHKRDAVREYRAYLNNVDNAPNRESVKVLILQLEKQIADEDAQAQRAAAAAAASQAAAKAPTVATPPSEPVVTSEADTARLTASAPARDEQKPAYKKWWVWTIVGGVVVGGAAAGLAIAFTRPSTPTANTTLGTSHPTF
jgi:tetratricopeptide (TPR) repeat protein